MWWLHYLRTVSNLKHCDLYSYIQYRFKNTRNAELGRGDGARSAGSSESAKRAHMVSELSVRFIQFPHRLRYLHSQKTQFLVRGFTPSTRPTGLPSGGEVTISILHAAYPAASWYDCVPIRTPCTSVPAILQTSVACIRWR